MSSPEHAILRILSELTVCFDGAFLGVLLAGCAVRAVIKFTSNCKALHKIRGAPELHVSDLRSLEPSGGQSLPSDGQNHGDPPVVIVRGTVIPKSVVDGSWWKKVLVSQESRDKAVVIERTRTYVHCEWTGFFQWTYDLRTVFERYLHKRELTSFKMVPFVLAENDQQPKLSYAVVKMDGSEQPLPLQTVYHQLQPLMTSPLAFLQLFFFPERPVGVLDEEKILPPGKEITAVGICSFKNGVLEIRSCKDLPYFLSELAKDQMILDLISRTQLLFCSSIVLGCLSLGILGYSSLRGWNRWKEWEQARQQPGVPPVDDDGSDEDTEDVPDGQLCCVCLMRRRVPAFVPCGHIACCRSCALTIERQVPPKCPICLQHIRGSMRVYHA